MTVEQAATLIISLGAAGAVLAGWWRWLRPKWRAVRQDSRAIRDTLVGRDAITDSITGKEIAPAIPGIGDRMASQETQTAEIARAVTALAESHRRIDDLDHRVTAIEQGHQLERLAGKAESVQLYRFLETVTKDEDGDDDGR